MPRSSVFSNPLLLGFEPFEQVLERIAKGAGDGYPPYNIEQVDERRLRITIAVAGFADDELSATVEDSQLVIEGRRHDDGAERTFLYRGIAARPFRRTFVLAEGLEVTGAEFKNGLLRIDIDRPLAESRARTIEIRSAGSGRTQTRGPTDLKAAGGR
ncbi:MAG TPA: Hsp20 family protein [Alphaproteobacteria bacterium]